MDRETCWTLVRAAAGGDARARSLFARNYLPVVRAYLVARGKGSALVGEVEDAIQRVFLECFRPHGVLERANPERTQGFGAFLLGTVRNIAANVERDRRRRQRHVQADSFHPERIECDETHLSKVFDRAWASAIMHQAGAVQRSDAQSKGEEAFRRIEILKLRFQDDLPIREIAVRLKIEPAKAHHEYALARAEFKRALKQVVAFHCPGARGQVEQECERLLALLG
jgi:RNA polymerase sigma-70 factor (ECF subfamily)